MDQPHKQLKVNIANSNFNQFGIYSVTGSKVYGSPIREDNFTVDMNGLNSGIYLIRMNGAASAYSAKFVIQ
jgi:hypothetical protein